MRATSPAAHSSATAPAKHGLIEKAPDCTNSTDRLPTVATHHFIVHSS
jgi:hypothetical protein